MAPCTGPAVVLQMSGIACFYLARKCLDSNLHGRAADGVTAATAAAVSVAGVAAGVAAAAVAICAGVTNFGGLRRCPYD